MHHDITISQYTVGPSALPTRDDGMKEPLRREYVVMKVNTAACAFNPIATQPVTDGSRHDGKEVPRRHNTESKISVR